MKHYFLPLIALLSSCALFQKGAKNKNTGPAVAPVVRIDTTKKSVVKPYKDIITDKAITQNSFFKVHRIEDKYFFEIPASLTNKDILIVNRVIKAPPLLGEPGTQIGETVVNFARVPKNKLFMKRAYFLKRVTDTLQENMNRAVQNANINPVVASFDIKAYGKDSSMVIDVTDYLNGDNDIFFFGFLTKNAATGIGLEGYQADKSYINTINAYPSNIEIKTVKTWLRATFANTFELNSSIVLLPENKMPSRFLDQRVGYFARGYYDYSGDRPVDTKWMINRWRLEPKPGEEQKYLAGELVEPVKPIVFYIDPNTPKKWVPFLMQGVKDWQQAFEKAGFKNAIYALEAPVNDTSWSLEDARHNAIIYKASPVENASGPQVSDPRTGEILESHIEWYHNLLKLLQAWYMIQVGPNDPRARKIQFDDQLMGQLVRFVCTHEVGHTLGLRHNFFSSATVPTDSLRNKNYVEAHGFCPSIMDYARFNYVAQPEDHIGEKGLFPRIGEYDEWAIKWGYRWFPQQWGEQHEQMLTKWVTDETSGNKKLWFGQETYEYPNQDPTRQSEDIGDDAMKSGAYGIANLKRVASQLRQWTKKEGADYGDLIELNRQITGQYFRYLNHVALNIGGRIWRRTNPDQNAVGISYPSFKTQQSAVAFLNKELFATPVWLSENKVSDNALTDPSYVSFDGDMHLINVLQRTILQKITSHTVTNNLLLAQTANGNDSYNVDQLFTDIEAEIWKELPKAAPIDIYRRNLQKLYIERLSDLIGGFFASRNSWDSQLYPVVTVTDIYPIIKDHLRSIQEQVARSLPLYKDKMSRLHLKEIQYRIKETLAPKHEEQTNSGLLKTKPAPRLGALTDEHPLELLLLPAVHNNCWSNEVSLPGL